MMTENTNAKSEGLQKSPPGFAFHLMAKPSGAKCNMDCVYCFYLRKENLYPGSSFRMSEEVLEAYVRQYIEAQENLPEIQFAWQGGEPTLLGLDFYRKAVALEEKYRRPGMHISNSFQTNGILLTEEWCRFFREHNFLVGLSLDGPERFHNFYRLDKGGQPTFKKVMRALHLLWKHKVDFNILCVVSRYNGDYPLEVYHFFKENGVQFIQFIPAVERRPDGKVTEWTVRPRQWGQFLCAIFDTWVRADVGRIFVQTFEVALQIWLGMPASLCVHAETCGNALILEHNGDIYSCDHFVGPQYRLGNILERPLIELVTSLAQQKFGQDKRDTLPSYCHRCSVKFACQGACPKDRFIKTPDGKSGLNYLCAGYKLFFAHIDPYMRFMAKELLAGRPTANIMAFLSQQNGQTKIGRNDPCPCGSGKKYKHCCLLKM